MVAAPFQTSDLRHRASVTDVFLYFILSIAVVLNFLYSATHYAIRHHQTTPFQNYESLNTCKCTCASSEEQKKGHHVHRCPNFRDQNQAKSKKVITFADATKGFLSNIKYLSRPLEKCLMTPMGVATPRLRTTSL